MVVAIAGNDLGGWTAIMTRDVVRPTFWIRSSAFPICSVIAGWDDSDDGHRKDFDQKRREKSSKGFPGKSFLSLQGSATFCDCGGHERRQTNFGSGWPAIG